MGLLFLGAGGFTPTASAQNWEWFFTHPRAWLFVKLLGRQGARIAYGVLGVALVLFGVVALLGRLFGGASSTR